MVSAMIRRMRKDQDEIYPGFSKVLKLIGRFQL